MSSVLHSIISYSPYPRLEPGLPHSVQHLHELFFSMDNTKRSAYDAQAKQWAEAWIQKWPSDSLGNIASITIFSEITKAFSDQFSKILKKNLYLNLRRTIVYVIFKGTTLNVKSQIWGQSNSEEKSDLWNRLPLSERRLVLLNPLLVQSLGKYKQSDWQFASAYSLKSCIEQTRKIQMVFHDTLSDSLKLRDSAEQKLLDKDLFITWLSPAALEIQEYLNYLLENREDISEISLLTAMEEIKHIVFSSNKGFYDVIDPSIYEEVVLSTFEEGHYPNLTTSSRHYNLFIKNVKKMIGIAQFTLFWPPPPPSCPTAFSLSPLSCSLHCVATDKETAPETKELFFHWTILKIYSLGCKTLSMRRDSSANQRLKSLGFIESGQNLILTLDRRPLEKIQARLQNL